ncbi:hypothetical protein CSC94_12795 [Zhengella mangrovi]|uniref:Uncharacterized protein n=1 Tax=Zhengella mangrovi TaxID=1982044 RepID=A0A2G1QM77_9HYPH|nr:hypothetical protein [Zhengella mangrovi]PHP66561.1 hypothetical protein CSC94_12795 [Zhengella mangrovi]
MTSVRIGDLPPAVEADDADLLPVSREGMAMKLQFAAIVAFVIAAIDAEATDLVAVYEEALT